MSTAMTPWPTPRPMTPAIARAGSWAACIAGSGWPVARRLCVPISSRQGALHGTHAVVRPAATRRAHRAQCRAPSTCRSTNSTSAGCELRVDATRRRLLQGAAAGVALTACAPVAQKPVPTGPTSSSSAQASRASAPHGVCARPACRRASIEAQSRVGGRMLSLRDHFPNGHVIELGGELIDTGHVRIRKLAQDLGLVLDDLLEGETGRGYLVVRRPPHRRGGDRARVRPPGAGDRRDVAVARRWRAGLQRHQPRIPRARRHVDRRLARHATASPAGCAS